MRPSNTLREHFGPAAAGAVTFLLLAAVVYVIHTQELLRHQQHVYTQTVQQLSTIRARAESSINKRIAMTAGLRALIASNPDITEEEFKKLGDALFSEGAGIRSITLNKNNIVTDVYPREGNEVTLGLNFSQHPEQGPALRKVIESGKAWLAGPIFLVQGGEAFIHRVPVFELHEDAEPGIGPYWGIVSTLIEKQTIVEEITDGIDPEMEIAICGLDSSDHIGRYFIGSSDIEQRAPCSQDISVPNGQWKISGVPKSGWPQTTPLTIPLIIGGGGISLLCAILVYLIVLSHNDYRIACGQALAASRAKSEFLANMSHEIRTPMTAILGYTEILNESISDPQARESIEIIQRNGSHLLDLINDILDLSKIEAREMKAEMISCSPRDMLRDIDMVMRNRAAQKNLTFETSIDPSIPDLISTDPTRLKQILINLVSNAIKFTQEGTVRLSACVLKDTSRPTLEFTISDTGIGMTSEQISRLFKPFTQADTSTTRKFGGTGLGLCISKRLAEMLGGTILVESTQGEGSTFRVQVTLMASCDVFDLNAAAPTENCSGSTVILPTFTGTPDKPLIGQRILLAEDGHDNQRLISFLLKKAGAEVSIVENGQEAIDLMSSECSSFDFIIMDMQMPVLDGYKAASALRAMGITQPILALTAHAMSDDEQKCLSAGCDAYLTKPIHRQKFLKSITKLLNRSKNSIKVEMSLSSTC